MKARNGIYVPLPGVAVYRENGAAVLLVHYTADEKKRDKKWRERVALDYPPDGVNSIGFRQEYEVDFEAEIGKLTYYAFNPRINVQPFPTVPVEWPWWLAFDFGSTTCCLFFAQDPASQTIYVFDEVYAVDRPVSEVKEAIYEKLCEHRGLRYGAAEPDEFLEDAVGDPTNPGLAREFGQDPHPISIRTKGWRSPGAMQLPWNLNDVRLGEARVNEYFTPGFWCCAKRQHQAEPGPANCRICNRERRAQPLLILVEGRCPNLERTLPDIVRKPSPGDGLEAPETDIIGLEDHAPDTLRYGCMRVVMDVPIGGEHDQRILETPGRFLQGHDLIEKIRLRAARIGLLNEDERRAMDLFYTGLKDEDGQPILTADDDTVLVYDPELDEDRYEGNELWM